MTGACVAASSSVVLLPFAAFQDLPAGTANGSYGSAIMWQMPSSSPYFMGVYAPAKITSLFVNVLLTDGGTKGGMRVFTIKADGTIRDVCDAGSWTNNAFNAVSLDIDEGDGIGLHFTTYRSNPYIKNAGGGTNTPGFYYGATSYYPSIPTIGSNVSTFIGTGNMAQYANGYTLDIRATGYYKSDVPVLLDNFETGSLGKWNGSTMFTASTSTPLVGTNSAYAATANAINTGTVPDGLWLSTLPSNYTHARGDIISTLGMISTSNEFMGIALNSTYTASGAYSISNGYAVLFNTNSFSLFSYTAGAATQLATTTYSYGYDTLFKIRAYVNPLSHPTAPGKFYAELLNPSTGAVLTSINATVTSANDYSNGSIGLVGQKSSKGGAAIFRWDNVRVEGRN